MYIIYNFNFRLNVTYESNLKFYLHNRLLLYHMYHIDIFAYVFHNNVMVHHPISISFHND